MLMTPPSTHRATQLNPHQWTCKSPYWLLGNTDSWGVFNRERLSKFPIPATHKFWRALALLNAPLIFAWLRIPFGLFSGMFNLPIDKYPIHLHTSNIYASVPFFVWISCENSKQGNRCKFYQEEIKWYSCESPVCFVSKNISYYTKS